MFSFFTFLVCSPPKICSFLQSSRDKILVISKQGLQAKQAQRVHKRLIAVC